MIRGTVLSLVNEPNKTWLSINMGHGSRVDKSSDYGAKGPGFKTRWKQEFIYINCLFCSFENIKLQLGQTLGKNG